MIVGSFDFCLFKSLCSGNIIITILMFGLCFGIAGFTNVHNSCVCLFVVAAAAAYMDLSFIVAVITFNHIDKIIVFLIPNVSTRKIVPFDKAISQNNKFVFIVFLQ